MKAKLLLILAVLMSALMYSQTNQSIEEYAKENGIPFLTASNGRYQEIFTNPKIKRIGTVMFNTEKNEVEYFITEGDTAFETAYNRSFDNSRFMSIDPLTKNFPFLSPYQFAGNSPIQSIDLDGLESFKINDNSVEFFDEKTGELKTYKTKQLVLTDVKAKFKVVDENDIELNNFKYCTFACQMIDFRVIQQISSGEGEAKIYTPNLGQLPKNNTSNTFLITTNKFEKVGFKSNEIYSLYYGLGSINADNLSDKIADLTQKAAIEMMRSKEKTTYNVNDDIKQFSILRISNGTNSTKDDIIKNLNEQGFYHDKINIEYTEAKSGEAGYGKLNIEYGNYECDSNNGCK